jgi:hypothetical protein
MNAVPDFSGSSWLLWSPTLSSLDVSPVSGENSSIVRRPVCENHRLDNQSYERERDDSRAGIAVLSVCRCRYRMIVIETHG